MIAILKTLPARFARGDIERFLGLDGKPCWNVYFFTLGRGRPSKAILKFELDAFGFTDKSEAWVGIDRLYPMRRKTPAFTYGDIRRRFCLSVVQCSR